MSSSLRHPASPGCLPGDASTQALRPRGAGLHAPGALTGLPGRQALGSHDSPGLHVRPGLTALAGHQALRVPTGRAGLHAPGALTGLPGRQARPGLTALAGHQALRVPTGRAGLHARRFRGAGGRHWLRSEVRLLARASRGWA